MANLLRGERTFEHDGSEYTLALDMDAFTEACQVLDMGLQAFMDALDGGDDVKPHILRALFYGAMFRHNPLPLGDCMSFMTAYGLERIAADLKALAVSVMPSAAAVEDTEGNVPPLLNRQQKRAAAKPKTSSGGKKKV